MVKRVLSLCSVTALVVTLSAAGAQARRTDDSMANAYRVHKLVSDVPGAAASVDPNLVNGWGLAAGPTTPWWVADNGTDMSTLYDGTGATLPLVVTVDGGPTGTVFNGSSDFVVSQTGRRDRRCSCSRPKRGRSAAGTPTSPAAALHAFVRRGEPLLPGGDLQGPRDLVEPAGEPAVRDRLPQRPRRRVRRQLHVVLRGPSSTRTFPMDTRRSASRRSAGTSS